MHGPRGVSFRGGGRGLRGSLSGSAAGVSGGLLGGGLQGPQGSLCGAAEGAQVLASFFKKGLVLWARIRGQKMGRVCFVNGRRRPTFWARNRGPQFLIKIRLWRPKMSNSLGPQFGLQVSPRRLTEITPGVHAEPHADTTSGIHAVQSHGLFRTLSCHSECLPTHAD